MAVFSLIIFYTAMAKRLPAQVDQNIRQVYPLSVEDS